MGWAAVAPILGAAARAGRAGAPVDTVAAAPRGAARASSSGSSASTSARLLKEHRGKVGEVARAAGIAERNLYEKMKAYGLSRDDYR